MQGVATFYIQYVDVGDNSNDHFETTYPGVAFFLQNLFILASSIIYKFGRTEDMWG